ncbi:MAG: glycosyltransferase family 4 protein [Chloroflexia bacterium]
MRLAWVSPLPPARTGIADYSSELLPALADCAEWALFGPRPFGASPLPDVVVQPLEELPRAAGRFDALLYHMGNNPYHRTIYELALRYPGVVVLHDFFLHHLVARCTVAAGDLEGYLWHLAYERGKAGAATALRRALGLFTEREQFLDPLNRVLLDRSRGAIVHSRWAAARVRKAHPDLPVAIVPHPLLGGAEVSPEEARRELGLSPEEAVVATFGFLAPYKRIDRLLSAWAYLSGEFPRARLLLVGEPDPTLELQRLLRRPGLERVTVTGYVDAPTFRRYIAACDVAVHLRYPSAGETSGAVMRLLGSGRAVLVSNVQPFAEWPDSICLKVDVGPDEVGMLVFYLRELLSNPTLCRRLGENARSYVYAHHAPQRTAEAYRSALEEVVARG